MQVEVLLTGIGGQGVQLAAKALAAAANDEGRDVMLSAHFGGEMRGGLTEASVAVADERLTCVPILPSAWSAYVMHAEFWPVVADRLRPGGVVVANSSVVGDHLPDVKEHRVFLVPAGALAMSLPAPGGGELSAPMSAGFVLLGAYSAVTGLVGIESLVAGMRRLIPPYRRQHADANEAAIRAGASAVPAGAAPAWVATAPGPAVSVT